MMWVNIACAASDFHNVNGINKQQPIGTIDMLNYIRAVTVLKALVSEITIAQSQGAPVIVPGSIIAKYFPTAALWQEKQLATSSPTSTTNQAATTPAPQNANAKRDHNTPEGGAPKEPSQQQIRTHQTPGVE